MNYCGYCGVKIDDTMSFCPNCGNKLVSCIDGGEISFCTQNASLINERTLSVEETEIAVDRENTDEVTVTYVAEEDSLNKASFPENSFPKITADNFDNKQNSGLSYVSLPDNKTSTGDALMGIIALVLGILSLSAIISSFMLTIDVYKQLTIPSHAFVITLFSAISGVVAIILSQKAIENGYKYEVSKAAEITGSIGVFCHVGVLFILLLGLFI